MNHIDKLNAATTETRAESHVRVLIKPGTLNARIASFLGSSGEYTRAQLSYALGVRESSLCGRLHELVGGGHVVVGPKVFNPETKRNVVTYRAAPPPVLDPAVWVSCA